MPIAASGADGGSSDPTATASASVNKKIKKLKAQVNELQAQVDGISPQPGPRGPAGEPGPSTGPAGGGLTGTYPNPQIAPNAVTSAKILDGTVADSDLAPRESVTQPALSNCVAATPWTGAPFFASQPGYWKDRSGVVHLQGAVGCVGADATEPATIFQLPAAYQPAGGEGVERFGVLGGTGALVSLAVLDDGSGSVVYDGPNSTTVDDYVSLSGINFRAGP